MSCQRANRPPVFSASVFLVSVTINTLALIKRCCHIFRIRCSRRYLKYPTDNRSPALEQDFELGLVDFRLHSNPSSICLLLPGVLYAPASKQPQRAISFQYLLPCAVVLIWLLVHHHYSLFS